MNKISSYLKLFWRKIRLWIFLVKRRNTAKLTGRGLYLFNYLVRRYLEQDETVETVEEYEKMITIVETRLADKPRPPQLSLHNFSAIIMSFIIFNSISTEDKEKCITFFTDNDARENFLANYKQFAPFR